MISSAKFSVSATPVAQPRQRHKIVKRRDGTCFVQNYSPTKHPVNGFKKSCRLAAKGVFESPVEGPIRVALVFVMPRPSNMVWKTRPMPRVAHHKKPDCDNLAKSVMDALSGVLWRDDSQVSELEVKKFIAAGDEQPHVQVAVRALKESAPLLFDPKD